MYHETCSQYAGCWDSWIACMGGIACTVAFVPCVAFTLQFLAAPKAMTHAEISAGEINNASFQRSLLPKGCPLVLPLPCLWRHGLDRSMEGTSMRKGRAR